MKFAVAALLTLVVGISEAAAQGVTVTAGPGAFISPPYEGAKHNKIGPLPWLNIGPAGPPRFAPDDSVGIGLFSGPVRAGIVGALRGKREATGERIGLRPVDTAIELGGFLDYWPSDWLRTRIEVKRGVSGHDGWIADLGADAFANAGPVTFTLGPRLGLGNETYMDKYFGVSLAEATASPIISAPYSPGGGVRYAGAAAGVIHRHGRWQEIVGVTWHELVGDAADSPMVTDVGSSSQFMIFLGLTYTFTLGN